MSTITITDVDPIQIVFRPDEAASYEEEGERVSVQAVATVWFTDGDRRFTQVVESPGMWGVTPFPLADNAGLDAIMLDQIKTLRAMLTAMGVSEVAVASPVKPVYVGGPDPADFFDFDNRITWEGHALAA